MKKGIIIYQGKYGATRQYAMWLARSLDLPLISATNMKRNSLAEYDYFLIGTSVYIGKLQISKWLKENADLLQGKKIFLFQVAASSPAESGKREAYNRNGIPTELMNNCTFFFLPGRTIISRLSWKDRFMLKLGARLAKDPADRKNMLTDHDDVKLENLSDMIRVLKQYMHPELIINY